MVPPDSKMLEFRMLMLGLSRFCFSPILSCQIFELSVSEFRVADVSDVSELQVFDVRSSESYLPEL